MSAQLHVAADVTLFYNNKNTIEINLNIRENKTREASITFQSMYILTKKRNELPPIKSIEITEQNGKKSNISLLENTIYFRDFSKIKSMRYEYDCTLTPIDVYQPTASQLIVDTLAFLQLNNFIPKISSQNERVNYAIKIENSKALYAVTTIDNYTNNTIDLLDYNEINGATVLYSKVDTLSIKYKKVNYKIAVYSDDAKKNNAKKIFNYVFQAIKAAVNELDSLRYDEFVFMFYISNKFNNTLYSEDKVGGMQHNNTSIYFLPNYKNEENTKKIIQQNVVHEMLHLLAPQQLHSDMIGLKNNQNSQYLWLYEGVTEYLAQKVLLKNGLINEDNFLNNIRYKIMRYRQSPPVSLCNMSRNIHKNKYKKNYDLIYNKGAVVAMMMDIEMMRRSDMQLNLLSFMKQLSKQYGYEKPFSELHLRDQFVNQCGLYMDDFFKKYIEGKRNVDLVTGFNQLGFQYHDSKHYTYCTFGDFYLDMENNEESLNVADAYANYLGLMVGDVIIEINEKKVKQLGMSEAATLLVNPIPKNYLMLTVLRNNSKVRLEGVPRMRTDVLKYVIEPMPRSDYQVKLHDYFIK